MSKVVSKDGTAIAYDRTGEGPAVILVDGALNQRGFGPNPPLAAELARRYTVFTYDRRGRGESGDTAPWAIEREVEDLHALIEEAGGSAHVYGISSGGALALEAAASGLAISKLALYELPFVVDDSRPPIPRDVAAQVRGLIQSGRRGAAVKRFMRAGVNLPAAMVATMPMLPAWSKLKSVAHTLPYDLQIMRYEAGAGAGQPLPAERWAGVTAPTLVVCGGKSPAWMRHSMTALAEALPSAEHRTLAGQTHIVKAAALAPVLTEFFAD